MRIIVVSFLMTLSNLAAASTFVCSGSVAEFGVVKTIEQKSVFEIMSKEPAKKSSVAEIVFNFKMSDASRLNLQVRALSENNVISYAATFSEVALQPLGRIENSFYEKLHTQSDGVISLNKTFTDLKFKIACFVQDAN